MCRLPRNRRVKAGLVVALLAGVGAIAILLHHPELTDPNVGRVAQETLRVARSFGGNYDGRPRVEVTPSRDFLHGKIYDYYGEFEEETGDTSDHLLLGLDKSSLRSPGLPGAWAMRSVTRHSATSVQTTAEAKALARRIGIPDSFLAGLRPAKGRLPSDYSLSGDDQPAFLAGPGPDHGTWEHPHVEIARDSVLIEVGERTD